MKVHHIHWRNEHLSHRHLGMPSWTPGPPHPGPRRWALKGLHFSHIQRTRDSLNKTGLKVPLISPLGQWESRAGWNPKAKEEGWEALGPEFRRIRELGVPHPVLPLVTDLSEPQFPCLQCRESGVRWPLLTLAFSGCRTLLIGEDSWRVAIGERSRRMEKDSSRDAKSQDVW